MATTILISSFPPFPTLTLTLPSDTPLAQIPSFLPDFLPNEDIVLSLSSRPLPLDETPLKALWEVPDGDGEDLSVSRSRLDGSFSKLPTFVSPVSEHVLSENGQALALGDALGNEVESLSHRLVSLRLSARVRGGKGGFGSQLRAAGGRMSSQKTSNNDSCRDLNGRRLSTIKEAKALAAYLESEPERIKARQEAQRQKLEKLERRLGIDEDGKPREEGSSVGAKRRFDDTEYIEQTKDIVDNVKSAVSAGLLKKRKKAKATTSLPVGGPESESQYDAIAKEVGSKTTEDKASRVRADEKALERPRAIPVSAGSAVSLAAIGA